jgi:hypothetical protein
VTEQLVYVIGSPGITLVKIGWTTNLRRRLSALRCMSPVPLDVLWSTAAEDGMEYGLHKLFGDIRSHGEWFDFGDRDPVAEVRQAVETSAWRPFATQPQSAPPRRDRAAELARKKVVFDELDQLAARYYEAQERLDKARDALHATICDLLKEGILRPGEVADRTPYDRNHIGRIARKAGVQTLRAPTVRAA